MRATESPDESVATIEGIILRNTITFDTLVGTNNFGVAWMHRSPVVLQYIVDHIEEVMKYALMIIPQPTSGLQSICLNILSSRETDLYQRLFESPVFLKIIQEIPQNITQYSVRSQVQYFDLMNNILISTNFSLFNLFDMKRYFKTLANTLIYDTPARFIQSMVISLTPTSYPVLTNASLCKILCQEYINSTVNGTTALRLIQNCFINEFFLRHAAESFQEKSILNSTWKIASEKKDFHGVDFLRNVCITAISFMQFSDWKKVTENMKSFLPQTTHILLTCSNYGIYENAVGKLFIVLQNGSHYIDNNSFQITVKSIDMMFSMPINSFVHNFALSCIQSFIQNGGDVDLLFDKTQLPKKIVQQYLKRGTTTAVYWGQLRIISEIIEPLIDTSQYANWTNIITESNQNTRHLMNIPICEYPQTVQKKTPTAIIYSIYRLPKRKRFVVLLGLASFILFLFVAFFL